MSSNGNFDLAHVWEQQKNDVHPPLYYILVHAVCTLFPNTFSVWYAAVINIGFALLTLIVFRKLIRLYTENTYINYIIVLAYILCAGVISISTFMRMYIMAMFEVTFFAYIILKKISGFTWKDFLLLTIIAICGALTHYYFILYIFFMSVVTVIMLALQKRIKEMMTYFFSMFAAGSFSYLIFPPMVTHIFESGHGKSSMEKLTDTVFMERINAFYDILNSNLFGGLFGIIAVVIILLITFIIVRKIRHNKNECKLDVLEVQRYILLVVPTILYIMVILKTAPYNADRYMSPVYTLLIAGVVLVLYKCILTASHNVRYTAVILSLVLFGMTSSGFFTSDWQYMNIDSKERLQHAEIYGSDADAICVYDRPWKINSHFLEISKCKSSIFYWAHDYEEFDDICDYDIWGDKIVLFIIGLDVEVFMEEFKKEYPGYEIVNQEQFGYGESVYLSK